MRFTADELEDEVRARMTAALGDLATDEKRPYGLDMQVANNAIFRGAVYALGDVLMACASRNIDARRALVEFVSDEMPKMIESWQAQGRA